uniref:Phage protein n=2 Tax=Vibrio TaxID=662 RepID=A0A0H3ZT85_9VIBR|nr:Phage protein [Vibrio cyclitrophicus]AKN38207.1 hypothetical protein [Vibrio splendidus]
MYYGLSSKTQLAEIAVLVCDVLGHGASKNAASLLIETCAAETLMGTARDTTLYGAGAGVSQVDKGTFEWLKEKYEGSSKAKRLKEVLNVDLSRVQYNELDFSPMLGLVFCRLRYMAVPDAIPKTMEGRADYWKRWYNSELGKGTPEEYLERCMSCGLRGGAL